MKTATIEQQTCASCPYFQDFGESNGRGWCATFDQVARLDHERTGACDAEIEALDKEELQQAELEQASNAGDKISHQLQPATEANTEFEQGCQHGRNDARAKWHPIYKEPATEYATGYLSGYNEVLNPQTQQPEPVKSAGWSATWDDLWQCYRVWATLDLPQLAHPSTERLVTPTNDLTHGWASCGKVFAGAGDRYNRYVGSATTYQEAERLGQQDAALDKTIKRQNAAVMAAYA